MKSLYKSLLVLGLAFTVTACFNKKRPNYRYFSNTDMYESPSYETYEEYPVFQNQQEAQNPVENTISRGWEVYPFPDTDEGKKAAIDSLENPLAFTERNVKEGGKLYDIYCAICHGFDGDGDGPLSTREKIMGIPAFDDANREINEGDMYHTMYYGLNNMGSYAAQTTIKERWQITHYVTTLQDELEGKEPREFEKDTSTNRDHFDKEIDPITGPNVMVSSDKK